MCRRSRRSSWDRSSLWRATATCRSSRYWGARPSFPTCRRGTSTTTARRPPRSFVRSLLLLLSPLNVQVSCAPIGDIPGMNVWEAIAADAARVAGALVAFVGVLQDEGERILGAIGNRQTAVTADASFAMRIRDAADLVVLADASADSRLASHPLVAGAPGIRFYAGVPLRDEHGAFVGALSIIDRASRTLSTEQIATLRMLGRHAERELLLRHLVEEADARFREFFEHTSDLVMTVGPDGQLFHANDTALTTLGITRGAPLDRVADADRRDELREVIATVFETRKPQR